jgi:hypothetical protein
MLLGVHPAGVDPDDVDPSHCATVRGVVAGHRSKALERTAARRAARAVEAG